MTAAKKTARKSSSKAPPRLVREDAPPRASTNGKKEAAHDAMHRAEKMVDHYGQRLGHFLANFGRQVNKLAARAREEAEDIMAEAQHLRRHRRK